MSSFYNGFYTSDSESQNLLSEIVKVLKLFCCLVVGVSSAKLMEGGLDWNFLRQNKLLINFF